MEWLSALFGAGLVLNTIGDILMTVLHSQKESRLNWAFNRAVWRALRLLSMVFPARYKHRVLAWSIPAMIAGLIGTWILLLVVGYALIYTPWISSPQHFTVPPTVSSHLVSALYFSGLTLATVGYGDITPQSPVFRLVTVTEGFTGLIVISMSITFLLTIYPSLIQTSSLAESLNEETDGAVDAVPMVARYLASGNFEALADRITHLNRELLAITEAHRLHSVLYYAHPMEVHLGLARVLVLLRGLITTIRFGLYEASQSQAQAYWNDPRVLTLQDSFSYTLRTFARSIHIPNYDDAPGPAADPTLRQEYRDLRKRLHTLGLVTSEAGGAEDAYVEFRLRSDAYITAYRQHAGYGSDELEELVRPVQVP